MRRFTLIAVLSALVLVIAAPAFANPGKPSFTPKLYADGELYGTKAATALPAPKGNNAHSFDQLFVITNSNNPEGQLPVAEAAPGRDFNGGRWATQTVEWTMEWLDAGTVPVLTSYEDVMAQYHLGHLDITPGSPDGGPPDYFLCPLLPVK
jgi:hypothetical protein